MPDLRTALSRVLPQLNHQPPKEGTDMRNHDLDSMHFDDEANVHTTPARATPAPVPATEPKPKPTTYVYRLYEVLKTNPGATAGELYKAAKKAKIKIDPHFVHVALSAYKSKNLVTAEKRPGEINSRYTATAPEYPTRNLRFDHKSRKRAVARRKNAIEAAAKALPKGKPRSDAPPVKSPPAKRAKLMVAETIRPNTAATVRPLATSNQEIQLILNTISVAMARKLYDELRKMFGG